MRRFAMAAVLAQAILMVACGGGSSQQTSVSSVLAKITITGQNGNLVVGQTAQLQATGLFGDGSTKNLTNSVSWASSNSGIATVGGGGMLTAAGSGQAVITASSQGVSGNVSVSIAPALVSIAVTPASPTIARQTTVQFIATGTFTDKSTQNLTSSVSWSSSNSAVATISSTAPTSGLATAVAAGSATITATSGTVTGSTTMTVSSASVTSLSVTPNNPTLALGLSQQFIATAGFSDGTHQDVTGVAQWQSSATSVASITVSGLATAKNIGTSTISATFGGMTATSAMTVNAANLTSITIKPANGSIAQGTTEQLAATGTFNDGSTRDVTFLCAWTSSNHAAATIGASSAVVATVAPGMTTITATLGSVTASTSLTVSDATIVSVVISPTGVSIPTGGAASFSALGIFSDSSTQDVTTQVSWASGNTAVATVSNSSPAGFAVGVSSGTATISATFSHGGATQSGSTTLTVTTATLASMTLTPATAEIAPASSQQYIATGKFTDGSTQSMTPLATWSSSNTSVAVVSHPGVVTGESGGVVAITAQIGAISATANLLVESAALTSIQITPQNSSVAAGFDIGFKATGTFSNGDTQDLTLFTTWTSSNPAIATVNTAQATAGIAAGVEAGTTTISALFAGQVGTSMLTVTNATLTAVAVTPPVASIAVGASQQLQAVGSFSDGSTLNLVAQVDWTSSDPKIATVNSQGVCDGLTSGTSTITAEVKGVQGTAILTVQ